MLGSRLDLGHSFSFILDIYMILLIHLAFFAYQKKISVIT